MVNRVKYDLTAEWDDPFEHTKESRGSSRCISEFPIKIAVQVANHSQLLVGPAVVHNISQTGLLCHTKHRLIVDQDVKISITSEAYTGTQPVPRKFVGTAKVVRATPPQDGVQHLGLEFGTDLSENMSFSLFIENLRNQTQIPTHKIPSGPVHTPAFHHKP